MRERKIMNYTKLHYDSEIVENIKSKISTLDRFEDDEYWLEHLKNNIELIVSTIDKAEEAWATFKNEKAIKYYKIASSLLGGDATLESRIARIYNYRLDDKIHIAIEHYEKAISYNSNDFRDYCPLAECYIEKEDYEKALISLINGHKNGELCDEELCKEFNWLLVRDKIKNFDILFAEYSSLTI